ncbi:MAG: hypothetical protein GEU99_17055 [Luteitalea sp.]|nr:hypothetical protein [Luteitalea sp.]
MILRNSLLLALTAWILLKAQSPTFDVMAYGAKGDGQTLDTAAIQRTVDVAHAAGGGVVSFPTGNFLSGTIELKSHVTLRLSPGATLWGSQKMEDYARPHLIYARGAENIAIDGGGTINGNGDAFWDADFKPRGKRPSPAIELVESEDIRIENIRIRNTAGWGIHPLVCDRVLIRGISIINDYRGPNTDGIDPDSTRNLIISDSYIETGDDAIVLKTTGRLGRPAPPCENITVTNCVLMSDDAALKLGTESHGDFRHIRVSNSVIRKSGAGVAIYGKDGGTFEDVSFSGLAIETSALEKRRSRTYPIYIDLDRRSEDSRQSQIRDITFSDITIRTKGRVLVTGMPAQPLENLTFRNISVRMTGFESLEGASQPRGSSSARRVAQRINHGPTPAALVVANAKGVRLDGYRVHWDTRGDAPERHALYFSGVQHLMISGFQGRPAAGNGKLAAIGLHETGDVFITGSRPGEETGVFVSGSGVAPAGITLSGNDLRHAGKKMAEGAVYIPRP